MLCAGQSPCHFCAGRGTPSLALILRWAETLPLLRCAQSLWRACPYFALGSHALTACLPRCEAESSVGDLATFAQGEWSGGGFLSFALTLPSQRPRPERELRKGAGFGQAQSKGKTQGPAPSAKVARSRPSAKNLGTRTQRKLPIARAAVSARTHALCAAY